MAAAGARGELVAGGAEGFGLAFTAETLWVGTAIEGVDGPTGHLAATAAAVTRVRGFGSWLSLTPSVEVGLRRDGGDAETGSGLDVGGGLGVSDPSTGLAVDVRVRMLLVHEAVGSASRGIGVAELSYDPTPFSRLGQLAQRRDG